MKVTSGWIALPRDMREHWLWKNPRKLKMWLEMVMMANWTDSHTIYGSVKYNLSRGQFATTMRQLSGKFECSTQTLLSFLNLLESESMIKRVMPGNKFTIITINDFEQYQPYPFGSKTFDKPLDRNILTHQFESIDLLERKLEHNIEHLKKNKEEINNSLSSSSREKILKEFELLNDDSNFWVDVAKGLGNDSVTIEVIETLKEKTKKFVGEQLSKGNEFESTKKMKRHLFNWLRKSQEFSEEREYKKYNIEKNIEKKNTNGQTSIDSKRGVDAHSPGGPGSSKGRF